MAKTLAQLNAIKSNDQAKQLKETNEFLIQFAELLSEWKTTNEQFNTRFNQMADELNKHVGIIQSIITTNSELQSNDLATASPSASTPLSSFLVPPTKLAFKRSLSPIKIEHTPHLKRVKSNDYKMPQMPSTSSDNNSKKDKNANSTAVKKYDNAFILISPFEVKKEKHEKVIVINSRKEGQMTVSLGTGLMRTTDSTAKSTVSSALRSTRSKPHTQTQAQAASTSNLDENSIITKKIPKKEQTEDKKVAGPKTGKTTVTATRTSGRKSVEAQPDAKVTKRKLTKK